MAYVRQAAVRPEEQIDENPTNPFISRQGGTAAGATEETGGTPSPNQQSSGTNGFTNLKRYLTANQSGAENLGTGVATNLNQAKTAAETGMGTAATNFTKRVGAATNIYNPNLVNAAATDASNYVNNADLKKQLTGEYGGPSTYAGSDEDTAAQKDLMAARNKELLAGTAGGRTQLLRNTLQTDTGPQTTTGGLNLNQFLLQNTQPAFEKVKTAAQAIEPLAGTYVNQADALQKKVADAQKTSLTTKQQALARLTQGNTDLQNLLTNTAANSSTNTSGNNSAYAAYLNALGTRGTVPNWVVGPTPQVDYGYKGAATASSNPPWGGVQTLGVTPQSTVLDQNAQEAQMLKDLGIDPGVMQELLSANTAARAAGKPGITLAQYLTAGTAGKPGTADVATAKQKADLAALATLLGTNNNFLQTGTGGSTAKFNIDAARAALAGQPAPAPAPTAAPKPAPAPAPAPAPTGTPNWVVGAGTGPNGTNGPAPTPAPPPVAANGGGNSISITGGGDNGWYGGGGEGTGSGPTGGVSTSPDSGNTAPGGVGISGGIGGMAADAVNGMMGETGQQNGMSVTGSTIGGIMGGPVGSAIGAAIGQAIGNVQGQTAMDAAVASQTANTTQDSDPGLNGTVGDSTGVGPAGDTGPGSSSATGVGNEGGTGGGSSSGVGGEGTAGGTTGDSSSAGVGNEGGVGGGSSSGNGGEGTAGDSGGGGGGGGKIICTLMNDFYGLPYKENKVWIKYATTHLQPEHQKGYHKVFLPLVAFAKKPGYINNKVRDALFYIGKHRTIDIQAELAGTYRRPVHKFLRAVIEPALYWIGRIK